jgi:ribosome-associated heat shock protein Hsp15
MLMKNSSNIRIDVYLWAIRVFKTRTQATKAIVDGKVKFLGDNIKASKAVQIGEIYAIKTPDKRSTIQIISVISKRVQYTEAILHYIDISTEEDILHNTNKQSSSFYTGKRLSKVGRPTKKTARDLTDFMDGSDKVAEED